LAPPVTAAPSTGPRSTWRVPMRPRRPDEEHRTSTPLELLFDLCFVAAVAAAAGELHHSASEGHAAEGLLVYATVFFAIWWAWMNFTWLASAFDPDDGVYRLTTLLQMVGVLVLAAGVPAVTDSADFTVVTIGYVVMRCALVGQWLRVARSAVEFRTTARWYAAGITIAQLLWVGRLFLPEQLLWPAFFVLVLVELAVPAVAESRRVTPWHPEHIAERYGLFTIIVLGEVILGVTAAFSGALGAAALETRDLIGLAVAGAVVVFALWWLYFDEPTGHLVAGLRRPWGWGYGHYGIFASVAAVGAGLEVAIDRDTGHFEGSEMVAGYAVPLPVALFLLLVWALRVRRRGARSSPAAQVGHPVAAVLVLVTPFLGAPVHLTAVVLAALVAVVQVAEDRAARRLSAASGPPG
jgi:low temperature requirement protein LtrA